MNDPLGLVGVLLAEKYLVERLVGEGGFAVVYRATHTIWKRPVALKLFHALSSAPAEQRPALQEAFINEGALLSELSAQTASIVQARDVGQLVTPSGQWMPYMVLEWLEGAPLDGLLEEETSSQRPPWNIEEVTRFLAPVARALDFAHARGIAHRDIKPGNIFVLGLDARAPGVGTKLLDFGVAKILTEGPEARASLAKTGLSITSFTPQYGAPEQFSRSHGATGPWTDVFALALVAVEMLIGRAALEGDDVVQLAVAAGSTGRRPTPRTLGVAVSDEVEAVFQRALAVVPDARYQRAAEFAMALESAVFGAPMSMVMPTAPVSTLMPSRVPTDPALHGAATVLSTAPGAVTTSPTAISGASAPTRSGLPLLIGGGAVALIAAVAAIAVFALPRGSAPASAGSVLSAEPAHSSAAAAGSAPQKLKECPPEMVLIPAGQFFMGSEDANAKENEKPSFNVTLDAFCIDRTEVTLAAYKSCSNSGKCRPAPKDVDYPGLVNPKLTPPENEKRKAVFSALCNAASTEDRSDHPVNCIDWEASDRYCSANGKRLPTEAEWEYTTRGPDGRLYPWGDEPPTVEHLNACGAECVKWTKDALGTEVKALYPEDDGFPSTSPVGRFKRGSSRFGPHDVVGNVAEWTADWYGQHTRDDKKNPKGPETGDKKVMRGGAFNGADRSWVRPAYRFGMDPKARSHGIGFRCAK